MLAGRYDLTLEAGATFSLTLTYKDANNAPVNLTGMTARMQLRRAANSTSSLLALTTENGRIALGGSAGTITLSIAAADTTGLSGSGFYDLELVNGANVERLLEGRFRVNPEVTK